MRIHPSLRILPILLVLVLIGAGCSQDATGPARPDRDRSVRFHEIPAGYYDLVDASTPQALRSSLHEVIDDHQRYPYTSTATDTWDILETADQDPNDPGSILDVYRNASYPKAGGGNTNYDREHTWPKSYGFPNDVVANVPYTDTHMLMLCDSGYNSSRSNKPYRYADASATEKPTEFNDGMGGGTGVYPGNSNWTSGSLTAGAWETWGGRRGDVARALLYMDVRYEGGTHGVTGVSEPDLILTDDEGLIAASNTGSNESVGYMGMLSVLLQWHQEDPVDDRERRRNDIVYSYQGNRNPFIDHPEWVDCIFSGTCGGGDTTPPAPPTGLVATAGDGTVDLDWDDNGEGDLGGYHVYRAETPGGPYTRVTAAILAVSAHVDATVTNGTTYYYVVTALDTSANESNDSNEASATPQGQGGGGPIAWINEFHYDNKGGDRGEFVEIAGPAGTTLSGWVVYGYNGSGGGVYDSVPLSGSIPDQQAGFGTVSVSFTGLQNGSPDGIALVDGTGAVLQFLSYEGPFTATDGPASGLVSTDVGVSENGNDPAGKSLQLVGTGTAYADFAWQAPANDSPGSVNSGQVFSGGGGDTTPPAAPTGLVAVAGDGSVDLDWNDNGEGDLDGYHLYRATVSGGPYTRVNGSLLTASAYTDTGVTNGTTYYYVATAVDLAANESGYGSEASATPEAVGGGGAMHVESIVLAMIPAGGPNNRGEATVTVVDAQGAPVAGATVTGTFTGDVGGTISGVTDAGGVVVLESPGKTKGAIVFTFCVDDVARTSWTYDAGANLETCDSFGAS